MLGEKVSAMAEICDGKEIDLIASGYNKAVLPHAWLSLISGLAGFNLKIVEPIPIPERIKTDQSLDRTKKVLEEVKGYLKDYWKCLR